MNYPEILNNIIKERKLSILIDPDKQDRYHLIKTIELAKLNQVDYILVGGSIVSNSLEEVVIHIKERCNIPVILFPGSCYQITDQADGILFLSLISGRNPEFLIGNQVIAAPFLSKTDLEIIPTGYLLIEGNKTSSAEYMSNTSPIPPDKINIIIATAQAGEMLGMKMIYLEGGSGVDKCIEPNIIRAVKSKISIPLIIGGGIKTKDDIMKSYEAGADMLVIGTAIEENLYLLEELTYYKAKFYN